MEIRKISSKMSDSIISNIIALDITNHNLVVGYHCDSSNFMRKLQAWNMDKFTNSIVPIGIPIKDHRLVLRPTGFSMYPDSTERVEFYFDYSILANSDYKNGFIHEIEDDQ